MQPTHMEKNFIRLYFYIFKKNRNKISEGRIDVFCFSVKDCANHE